ncbi:TrmB family transcriptional regulator [Haloplanus halophilus]|uniref:TrmB family transcriptional regulator n=1 Tax=Haloplanus halophilus TaxID=2949993 RepID=UPI002040DD9B|nr:helix-turn-helix domain-containing protein [Haloplanus sp. GDY1]
MSGDPSDQARSTAVEQLKALGLSTYAARTFVALVSLGEATAQDVSEVADVPRTRVYDAAEELQQRGLVDVKRSSPKRYWAISTETTGRHFEQEYAHRVTALTDALDAIETTDRTTEQRGVWTVTGRDTVTERVVDFVSAADEEVVYMTVEELLTEEVTDSLSRASERGVSIRLAEMSESTQDRFEREVPGAQRFESLWDWSETPAGRLLTVDQERTLVSVLVDGDGDHPPEPRDETAIWGSGPSNSLVVVLKVMFTWQLDESRGEDSVQ